MSGELNDDEYMSARTLSSQLDQETYRAVSLDQLSQDKFRSAGDFATLGVHADPSGAPDLLGLAPKSFDPRFLASGSGLPAHFGPIKSDFGFGQTLRTASVALQKPQPQQPAVPALPAFYERSFSLVCPHTPALELRDLIYELVQSSDRAELCLEQEDEFAVRARALSGHASAPFVVYFFQWPQGGVLVEFQRRSGDIGAFLDVFKQFSASLRSHTDAPAPKARSGSSLSSPQLLAPAGESDFPMLSLAMPSLSSMSSASSSSSSFSSAAAESHSAPRSSSSAADKFPLTSLPSGLIEMLKSDLLEHQQQATEVFCHLSGSLSKDTSLPADFPELLAGLIRSPDFDVARCALVCVANAANLVHCRDEFAHSFVVLKGLLDVLSHSSSVACLREAVRAICNLCASPEACDSISRLNWRPVLDRHCSSHDAALSERSAAAFDLLCAAADL